MTTRTLPNNFPFVHPQEGWTGEFMKASLFRRLAQAQNYLWSNARRVYGGHGLATQGNYVSNPRTTSEPPDQTSLLPDGLFGKHVSTFFMPRNWMASGVVKFTARINAVLGAGSSNPIIYFVLYRLDGTATGKYAKTTIAKPGTDYYTAFLRVPQDADYYVNVFLNFTTAVNDTPQNSYCELLYCGARYYEANADDLHGLAFTDIKPWANRYDLPGTAFPSCASAFWDRIIHNTLWHWAARNPEVAHCWLGDPWSGPSGTTWKNVGYYKPYVTRGVTTIGGQLQVRVTGVGGAGAEVRLLQNGTVVQTWTSLPLADNTLTVTPFAPPTDIQSDGGEVEFAVEARNPTTNNWGTVVWGVNLWENTVSLVGTTGYLPAAPANFSPLDEDLCDGDDALLASNFNKLQQNDRWLMKNRPRVLVGDWRHKVLKRVFMNVGIGAGSDVDSRLDWTPSGTMTGSDRGNYRNMTLRGDSDSLNNTDGLGDYPQGVATMTADYLSAGPYIYPNSNSGGLNWFLHGRRVGRYPVNVPSGLQCHPTQYGAKYIVMVRGNRVRPSYVSTDSNGRGPVPEESKYINAGFFSIEYGGSAQGTNIGINQAVGDTVPAWLNAFRALHSTAAGNTSVLNVRGRLPSQSYTPPLPSQRPEGYLFEVEAEALYVADEPLSSDLLQTLP